MTVFRNPGVDRDNPYPAALAAILSRAAAADAFAEISRWPGYAPTPLVDLPRLASASRVARLAVKDESGRFGLGSFKALGGAYALTRVLGGAEAANLVVTCATDGNHGRSVAWGAQRFGCRAVIYVHETVSAGRKAAIAAFGAEIVVVPGTYDDAVRVCATDAATHGRVIVSDTSWEGYRDVPRDVMQGYAVMVAEALDAFGRDPPTHVFVPGGVGGVAAATVAEVWERHGPDRPCVVVVEPDRADCLLASARAGHVVSVPGDLDTIMAGLACGEPSPLAWAILDPGADAFQAIPDAAAMAAMRRLADPLAGDPPVIAGESGAAALAGLLAMLDDPAARKALDLGPTSRVLCFSTEGATDPELYERIVGRPATAVMLPAATPMGSPPLPP